jgi:hypothetical protein
MVSLKTIEDAKCLQEFVLSKFSSSYFCEIGWATMDRPVIATHLPPLMKNCLSGGLPLPEWQSSTMYFSKTKARGWF